jgi:hypothetical protein
MNDNNRVFGIVENGVFLRLLTRNDPAGPTRLTNLSPQVSVTPDTGRARSK